MRHIDKRWSPRRLAAFTAAIAVLVLIDQATKLIIRSNLSYGSTWPDGWELIRISHVTNTGIAFGFLQGNSGALAIIVTTALIFFVITVLRREKLTEISDYCFAAILSGAIGNLWDRFQRGEVTDFIDPIYYPSFNVADSLISMAAVVLIGHFLIFESRTTQKSSETLE